MTGREILESQTGVAIRDGVHIRVISRRQVGFGYRVASAIVFSPAPSRNGVKRWRAVAIFATDPAAKPATWSDIDWVGGRRFPRLNSKLIEDPTLMKWLSGYCDCCYNASGYPSMWEARS